ncbi:aminotransferase class V-fold PLP-dependent enzyme, partial [Halobacillus sp. BBL2006]|uniref:aminotransferase class V-fold PLP-dependent enzyme n=1 Tax=Halobacillus sp. BBL2006 TaxID=1543706 RepID=UPI0005435AC1
LPGTVAFVKALRLILEIQKRSIEDLFSLRRELWNELEQLDGVVINSPRDGAPHIINFSIPGYKPEVVIHDLGEKDIFISTKSACSSKQPDVSSVLKACNLDRDRTTSALRISLSFQNTKEEVLAFIETLKGTINKLQPTMGR